MFSLIASGLWSALMPRLQARLTIGRSTFLLRWVILETTLTACVMARCRSVTMHACMVARFKTFSSAPLRREASRLNF